MSNQLALDIINEQLTRKQKSFFSTIFILLRTIRQVRKPKFSSHIFQVLICVQAKCFLYALASPHVHSFNECNLAKTSIEYVTTLLKTLQWISVFANLRDCECECLSLPWPLPRLILTHSPGTSHTGLDRPSVLPPFFPPMCISVVCFLPSLSLYLNVTFSMR